MKNNSYLLESTTANIFHKLVDILNKRNFRIFALTGIWMVTAVISAIKMQKAPWPDELDYIQYAKSLIQYGDFYTDNMVRTRAWPPIMPFYITPFVYFGISILVARLLLSITSLIVIILFLKNHYIIKSKLSFACWSMLFAFTPLFAYISVTLYPQAIAALLMLLALLINDKRVGYGKKANLYPRFILADIISGLLGLANLLIASSWLFWEVFQRKIYKERPLVILTFVTAFLLPAICYTTFSKFTYGSFTISTNGGLNLYIGNNPASFPGQDITQKIATHCWNFDNELQIDQCLKTQALMNISQNPSFYAILYLKKIAYSVFPVESYASGKTFGLLKYAYPTLHLLLIFSCIVVYLSRKDKNALNALVLILIWAATYSFFFIRVRFLLPSDLIALLLLVRAASVQIEDSTLNSKKYLTN